MENISQIVFYQLVHHQTFFPRPPLNITQIYIYLTKVPKKTFIPNQYSTLPAEIALFLIINQSMEIRRGLVAEQPHLNMDEKEI